jgi:hypothetical protein
MGVKFLAMGYVIGTRLCMTSNDSLLLDMLVDKGFLPPQDIASFRQAATERSMSVIDYMILFDYASLADMYEAIGRLFSRSFVRIGSFSPSPRILEEIDVSMARSMQVIPLFENNGVLTVTISDPFKVQEIMDDLKDILKRDVDVVFSTPSEIFSAVDRLYPENGVTAILDEVVDRIDRKQEKEES